MKRVLLSLFVAGLLCAGLAGAANTPTVVATSPLHAYLQAAPADKNGFLGDITVTLTNTSRRAVRVSKWELPSGLREQRLFEVTRDGTEVLFLGRIVERGPSPAADFIALAPGRSITQRINLADAYDMRQSNNYTVRFVSALHQTQDATGGTLRTTAGVPVLLETPPLRLWVDGQDLVAQLNPSAVRRSPLEQHMQAPTAAAATVVIGGVGMTDCTADRQLTLTTAMTAAKTLTLTAQTKLTLNLLPYAYVRWFGVNEATRYSTVKTHYTAMNTALNQGGGKPNLSCNCPQGSANTCLLYTSPSPRDRTRSRMPSSA